MQGRIEIKKKLKGCFRYVSMADCVLYYEDMDNIGFKLDSVAKISEPHFGEKLIYSFWAISCLPGK